jgi:hypothetical protein
MPRFKAKTSLELGKDLKALGVTKALEGGADFFFSPILIFDALELFEGPTVGASHFLSLFINLLGPFIVLLCTV